MIYSLVAIPFADMKSNMLLIIEEVGILISVLLLIFIKLDLRREMTGGLAVALLIRNILRKCCPHNIAQQGSLQTQEMTTMSASVIPTENEVNM